MTLKGLLKTILALVIIGAAVAIGWAVATATNPYAPGNATATPVVAQANNQGAARPTAIPTFTPASSAVTGTNTTPGAGGTGQDRQQAAPITGTITTYDTTSKMVTVKDATGKDQQFDATNARVTKTQKLASADFSSAIGTNGIVLLTGTQGSDGTYAATSLVAVDPTAFGGGAAGGRGGAANGTPGAGGTGANGAAASGTPGAGGTGTGRGTGGFGGGGFGGAGGGVIVRSGTLQGNTFTGTDATGQPIKATISDTTLLEKQAAGTVDDLKAGTNVSVISRAATTGTTPQALTIAIS